MLSAIASASASGSSPRLRGTLPRRCDCWGRLRFIPAFAGNTWSSPRRTWKSSVHPRVCGEHAPPAAMDSTVAGSSPRLRGTREHHRILRDRTRFIPAFAGNTMVRIRWWDGATVHPRVCGEHVLTEDAIGDLIGSSPRLRGTHQADTLRQRVQRFIPAFAGNTRCGRRAPAQAAVHPRVCGEHQPRAGVDSHRAGSSPRLRGTHPPGTRQEHAVRFIPAFAGNTSWRKKHCCTCSVHPRVCGEHKGSALIRASLPGSSPRLRGTLDRPRWLARGCRFIPAFAGNTLW